MGMHATYAEASASALRGTLLPNVFQDAQQHKLCMLCKYGQVMGKLVAVVTHVLSALSPFATICWDRLLPFLLSAIS